MNMDICLEKLQGKNEQLAKKDIEIKELKEKLKKADALWLKMQKDCTAAISTTWRFIGAYRKENAVPIKSALTSAEYHLTKADWIIDELHIKETK